ncbi:hypothetical protein J2T14_003092 [Paenibacillus harenae]|nr:hypothetical protein [Paenibacillus harenae]
MNDIGRFSLPKRRNTRHVGKAIEISSKKCRYCEYVLDFGGLLE